MVTLDWQGFPQAKGGADVNGESGCSDQRNGCGDESEGRSALGATVAGTIDGDAGLPEPLATAA